MWFSLMNRTVPQASTIRLQIQHFLCRACHKCCCVFALKLPAQLSGQSQSMLPQVNSDPAALDTLLNMGFNRDSATRALQQCHDDQAKAVDTLVSWGRAARAAGSSDVGEVASGSGDVSGSAGRSVTGTNVSQPAADAASLLAQALQSSKSGTHIQLPACSCSDCTLFQMMQHTVPLLLDDAASSKELAVLSQDVVLTSACKRSVCLKVSPRATVCPGTNAS